MYMFVVMGPDQVLSLFLDMEAQGVRLWLMGGWGVDALVGRQTRPHHDVDVLVEVATLERFRERLHELGFEFQYLWDDETWSVHDQSWSNADAQPTAFVYAHPDGREIDVHVVRRDEHRGVMTLWNAPYEFTLGGLQGTGTVAGHRVRCLTREMQIEAHTGYDLPPHHVADLQLLSAARVTSVAAE
jgi:lincosamide nucleotidyltransferase A/C/D/E